MIACGYNEDSTTNGDAYGEIWEYLSGNQQFIYFQTLSHGILGASVTHFFYKNNVYIYYTQGSHNLFQATQKMSHHLIFTWFVLYL